MMLMKARAEKLKTKLVFLTPNAYTVDEEVMEMKMTMTIFYHRQRYSHNAPLTPPPLTISYPLPLSLLICVHGG